MYFVQSLDALLKISPANFLQAASPPRLMAKVKTSIKSMFSISRYTAGCVCYFSKHLRTRYKVDKGHHKLSEPEFEKLSALLYAFHPP
jgi:hypothetical protein